jgi:hypothetical protein
MKLITTLAIIRQHDPCTDGWKKLLKHVGKDYPENGHIDFATILESNGLDDALWALRAVLPEQEKDRDRLARLFACDCAEAVLHIYDKDYPDDNRPREAVRVARAFAEGKATGDELAAAMDAARAAARDAARDAAWDAAWAAAWAAARDAAWDAARDAARDAAWAAAWAAARAAAWAAARDAARDAQREIFKRYFCQD